MVATLLADTRVLDKQDLAALIDKKNLAEDYDTDILNRIGMKVVEWFDEDEDSRRAWCERNDQYLKLATQVVERKTTPWPGAANVKYPLLTTAALQFAARAYPALVPGPNLVAGLVIGRDQDGSKTEVAGRIGRHMSYQLLWEMDNWEEDMDKLCFILPIVGCLFKKTYYDPMEEKNVSELILPDALVVDYYAKSVECAARKSEIIWRTQNQVQERINKGLFLDVDLKQPEAHTKGPARDAIDGLTAPKRTSATPHKFIECHCSWDMDDDGYDEPYIVTVHYQTKQVVRIKARWSIEGIVTTPDEKTGKEKFVKINPDEYYTKFGFIPNPDGSIYDLGFGLLLGGINESVNTLTNQLLDSGTLNNLQAGFLGRGIRIRGGNSRFIPGEWKPADFTGDDIRKHIFPLPTKEPSDVLFKLLETLVTSGKELASVAEIFVGKMPGQNTPATTTMATIEQGLKVFTAIYKRIYRSLGKEYSKLFKLNSVHLPDEQLYFTLNEAKGAQGGSVARSDYDPNNLTVKPNADPNIVSDAQKLMKVQSYGPLLQLQTINPKEYTKRFLEAVNAENVEALMNFQPPPNPEMQKMQMEGQQAQQSHQMDMQKSQQDTYQAAQEAQMKAQLEAYKAQQDAKSKEQEMRIAAMEAELEQRKASVAMYQQVQQHQLDMKHSQETHAQEMQHQEEMAKVKQQVALRPKPTPNK